MIITRKHLPRRTFVRGLGVAMGLPFLDAMTPALSAAKLSAGPLRMAFQYVPNGVVMENWTPATTGPGFEFTRTLKPLEPFRDRMLVISGLMDHNANALGDGGGDHARAGASFLTGAHPKKTGGSDIYVGISVDQVAAQAVGGVTSLPSLELGLDDTRVVGHCDSGYSCAYTNSISWRSPTTPNPPETNPRSVFERLFGDVDTSLDAETRARRAAYRRSLLDLTREETKNLMGALGSSDRRKLDEYLESVRAVEQRIEKAEANEREIDPGIEKPGGIPIDFNDHAGIMFDLQAIAMQADVTRIVTNIIGREGSVRSYPQVGVDEPHHPLSHHRNDPNALERLTMINTYHVELFSRFIGKLAATPDGDGTLLDHSMILYGCGISDSNRHIHENLPIVVMGGVNGKMQMGRHVAYTEDTPVSNLYLTMLDRIGVQQESLGDSTGKLEL